MKKIFTLLFILISFNSIGQISDSMRYNINQTIKDIKIISYLQTNKMLIKGFNTIEVIDDKVYVNKVVRIVPKSLTDSVRNISIKIKI